MKILNFYDRPFKVALSAVLLCAFLLPVQAQVNTEKHRASEDDKGFSGNIDLSFAWYRGNTDLLTLDADLGLYYNTARNRYFIKGMIKYGEKNDSSYIDKGFLHLRAIRRFGGRFMGELFFQEEFNKFILLKERTLVGGGLRIALVRSRFGTEKKKNFSLYLGSGIMWESEEYTAAEDGSQKSDASLVKSTNYLSLVLTTPSIGLALVNYLQFHTQHFAAYRIYTDLSVDFRINSRLSYQTKLSLRYDNRPPLTIEKTDIQVTNGLSLSF